MANVDWTRGHDAVHDHWTDDSLDYVLDIEVCCGGVLGHDDYLQVGVIKRVHPCGFCRCGWHVGMVWLASCVLSAD